MIENKTWRNPVRAKLEAGEAVVAITITTNNLESAALAATLGFDFLWIEMEHSPITLETLRAMVLATRGLPAAVFARVPTVELWTAKRVLDAGGEILRICVDAGGTITGEHGIGVEKRDYMPLIFSEADMDAMARLKTVFRAGRQFNPCKAFPTAKGCGETHQGPAMRSLGPLTRGTSNR